MVNVNQASSVPLRAASVPPTLAGRCHGRSKWSEARELPRRAGERTPESRIAEAFSCWEAPAVRARGSDRP
jgi:hypothetical protein